MAHGRRTGERSGYRRRGVEGESLAHRQDSLGIDFDEAARRSRRSTPCSPASACQYSEPPMRVYKKTSALSMVAEVRRAAAPVRSDGRRMGRVYYVRSDSLVRASAPSSTLVSSDRSILSASIKLRGLRRAHQALRGAVDQGRRSPGPRGLGQGNAYVDEILFEACQLYPFSEKDSCAL